MQERGRWRAIVIGSGFGASAAALELTEDAPGARDRADRRVLMLERGMPHPPGSFARAPREMRANLWDPAAGLHGLFELWSFRHVRALVASGLGGGSLIYASVLLPKPAGTFGADGPNGGLAWPLTEADHLALAVAGAEASRRLGAQTLPYDGSRVPKAAAFDDAARRIGVQARPAPVAVRFTDPAGRARPDAEFDDGSGNLHRRPRRTCGLVGECDLGCNHGAKNTLDFAYHGDLDHRGVSIYTCCEVYAIRALGDEGFEVCWREHRAARVQTRRRYPDGGWERLLDPAGESGPGAAADAWTRRATAPVVVLGAGTFGSTRLLLASRPGLPRLSDQLGRRFSTNGDLLTFARDCRDADGRPRRLAPSRGPVISRVAEVEVDGHRLWMQDAGGPTLSEWMWQGPALARGAWRARALLPALLRGRPGGRISRLASTAIGDPAPSDAMLPMLTMGRDVSGGRLIPHGTGLDLDWTPNGDSAGHFAAAAKLAGRFAHGLGGRLAPPGFARLARGLTAHPLGGCPMSDSPATGVVDRQGSVFGHPGLYVCDGSILPGPVGPNPSLTIAALGTLVGRAARARLPALPGAPAEPAAPSDAKERPPEEAA